MDEAAMPAGRAGAAEDGVANRLRSLAETVSPIEIAELWVFPPLAELESSAEFFLFTRFHGEERRILYSARLRRQNGNGSAERQVVVEHGSVPADRVPRLVERLQKRLGRNGQGQPFHAVIEGSLARWKALFGEAGDERGFPDDSGAGGNGSAGGIRRGAAAGKVENGAASD